MILGRARLPACGPADVRADAGPGLDVLLEDLRHLGRDPVRDHAMALRPAPAGSCPRPRRRRRPCGSPSARSRCPRRRAWRTPRPCRAARRRSSRGRATARTRPSLVFSDERMPEPVRHRGHLLRTEVERQARVDGVVREQRRVRDRRRADVRCASRWRRPRAPGSGRAGSGAAPRGTSSCRGRCPAETAWVRTNVLKVEPAWRRAWAARLNWFPARPGVTAVIVLIAPRARVDGDERRRRVGVVVERVLDRLASAARCMRGSIVVYTLSPPERTVCRAVLLDQLVADVAEEVGLADPAVDPPRASGGGR